MADQATYFAVGNLTGIIPAPALSAAERHEVHQRVPGLRFEIASARTSIRSGSSTEIRLGRSAVARPAPGAPPTLRRAVNAGLTLEALRHQGCRLARDATGSPQHRGNAGARDPGACRTPTNGCHSRCHRTLNTQNLVQKYLMILIGICTLKYHTVPLIPTLYP